MLRLREIDLKLEEMRTFLAREHKSEQDKLYAEHLKSLTIAYQKERIKALVRRVDDADYDRMKVFEDLIPKGMYR